jgi:hypothetical protein
VILNETQRCEVIMAKQLLAEKEYLGLEAGLGAAADEEEIEEQAEQAVEQGQEHDLPSSQARLPAQISC